MAIYHLHAKIISRKNSSSQDTDSLSIGQKGRSSTGAAAYRAGEKIVDERTKAIFDYSKRKGVIHAEVIMPQNSEWKPTRSELWNSVELKNKREDSQVAREFEMALPVELTMDQRRELAKSFAQELVDRYKIAADVCLHEPKEGENPHVHILTTTNRIEGNGLGKKVRELDMIANARGEGKEKGKNEIDYLRERWETLTNDALVCAGRDDVRIDHRTLAAQGVDREPTTHEGVAVTAMERKGIKTEIREENERRKRGQEELRAVDEVISTKELEAVELRKGISELKALEKWAALEIELQRLADEAIALWDAELKVQQLERERKKIAAEQVRNQWRDAGKKFASKNKPVGGFEANRPTQPIKIYGYEAVPHNDGTIFYHPNGKSSEVAFVDRHTSLELYENSDKTIVEMLNLSAKKWPDGFYLRGDDEFRARAEALAKKWGVADKVKNPLKPMSVSPTPAPKVEPTLPLIDEREQQKLAEEPVSRESYEMDVSTLDTWARFILNDMQREQKGLEKFRTAQSLDEKIKKKQESVEELKKQEGGVIKRLLLTYEVVADRKKEEKELAGLLKEREELGDAPAIKPQFKSYTPKAAKRLSEERFPECAENVRLYEEQQRERDEEKAVLEAAEQKRIEEQERAMEEAKQRAKMEIIIEAKEHLGDVKIIDADTWEDHDGKIIVKNERYAVQQTRERAVCHELRNNPSLKSFSVGDNVAISYDGSGRGTTERFDAKKHDRGRGLGR